MAQVRPKFVQRFFNVGSGLPIPIFVGKYSPKFVQSHTKGIFIMDKIEATSILQFPRVQQTQQLIKIKTALHTELFTTQGFIKSTKISFSAIQNQDSSDPIKICKILTHSQMVCLGAVHKRRRQLGGWRGQKLVKITQGQY